MNNSKIKYDVIIVGAGITGIAAGNYLNENGLNIKLLDKGKAIGGRLATRKIVTQNQHIKVDYGCKYIEANSFEFSQAVVGLIKNNTVKKWKIVNQNSLLNEIEKNIRFIGKQSMRQIALELSQNLSISNGIKITKIYREAGIWNLIDEDDNLYFSEAILLTMPVPQILELLKNSDITIVPVKRDGLEKVEYARSIAAILTLETSSTLTDEGGVKLENSAISFVTDNNLKGVNEGPTTITVEMSNDFSVKNWDKTEEEIANNIIEESSDFLNSKVINYQIHKWKYSTPIKIYPKKYEYIIEPGPIYFAGDAFLGNNVESAYLSGLNAAKSMAQILLPSLFENEIQ
ncbi:MAG: FAD-dependent oxidoreductase [Melioribacteraceae bacterium]|nr:FAD-dependent oxidoreductase [Melioribacteraceae bacterium]